MLPVGIIKLRFWTSNLENRGVIFVLQKYIQVPYIKTFFGLATPALIISVAYLVALSVLLIVAKKKGPLKIGIVEIPKLMQGDKNKIIISMIGYIIFVFSCINLPEFLGEESILLKISITYLKFETIVFILLFVFLCSAFLNSTNRETHIKASNCALHYLIWISLGMGILSGQLDYSYWKNIVVIVCAWILNGLFFVVDIRSNRENSSILEKFDLIPYGAVKNTEDLFPAHKDQAEDIANIISNSSPEPFSICLSGAWGTGKTSVMNGVIEILKENADIPYDIIYINALELDNKKTVLTYLMTQIRERLKARGVYVGVNSEYKEFVSSFAGTITSSAIGAFLQKKLTNDDDYRAQKQNLEEVLERTYKNGKLIVVVDDIERCDRNTAREYLFLVKEVATMRSCVSVFITDYDMLNKIVSDEKVLKNSPDFLNKFFNYKVDLEDETPENILAFYDVFFNQEDAAFWSIYRIICKSPGTWYNEAVAGLTAKLSKLENDSNRLHLKDEDQKLLAKKIKQQKECLSIFTRLMQNPRNVAKFYNVFRKHALYCEKQLQLSSNNEASKYVDSRNIGQVLYLLSFMEVCLPAEYEQTKRRGSRYIDPPLYGVDTIPNTNRRLVTELAQGLIFGEYFEFKKPDGYIKEDIRKFIECFLSRNTELSELINPFTTQEEEWIHAITASNYEVIEAHWEEMILMVFQKAPNKAVGITDTWRKETFLYLLEFAEKQVVAGLWPSNKVFSLFDSDLHADRFWPLGTGLMQTFWDHLNKSTAYTKPEREIINNLCVFTSHYAYSRCGTIYRLAHYLIPLSDNDKTGKVQECLLDSNKSLGQNLSLFLKKFEGVVPGFLFSSYAWYDNFKELATKIRDFLINKGLVECPDVKKDILYMFDTAEELKSLENIVEWINGGEKENTQISFSKVSAANIDTLIQHFEKKVNEPSSDFSERREFEKEFSDFFEKLRDADDLTLTEDQTKRLHQIVSRIVEQFPVSGIWYRRIILKIPVRSN